MTRNVVVSTKTSYMYIFYEYKFSINFSKRYKTVFRIKTIKSYMKRVRTHFQLSDCHAMRFFRLTHFKNKELHSYFNVVNKRNCNILPQKILDQI